MGPADDSLNPPRTVKPRGRTVRTLPVVAIHRADVLDEGGELSTLADLIHSLPNRPPTLFSTVASPDLLAHLDEHFRPLHPNAWQWRTSTHEREMVRPDGKRVATRVSIVTHYFGWKGGNFHKVIDPVIMYGQSIDKIWPGDDPVLMRLLRWGVILRDFCRDNNVEVRPTIGSLSGQFMRDPRFYPHARRKVPAKINERAREQLPGNFYVLNTEPRQQEFTAQYLDQRRAHHYHAARIKFPSSNTLYAYGRFRDLSEIVFDIDRFPEFYGLYCLDLVREQRPLPFAFAKRAIIQEKVFVWSNELQHLLDSGYRVLGVRAAWGSRHRDEGLNRYAKWCDEQLETYDDGKWLKPLLLSAYGTLAVKPRQVEAVFRLAKSGTDVTFRTGRLSLSGRHVQAARKLEPGIANVLHRGMIEAATRSESVGLAQYLSALGHNVLSIYADAVIVECDDDLPVPLLPDPWRNKRTLHRLEFINQQAFTSGEMTKLPGVSGKDVLLSLRPPMPRMFNVAEEMELAEF